MTLDRPVDAVADNPTRLDRDGAVRHAGAASSLLDRLDNLAAKYPGQAGVRLVGESLMRGIVGCGTPIYDLAAAVLGPDARPVRALLFDKSPTANWALGWHQDRTIAVAARHDVAGFGPWTVKAGIHHVEPPFAIIASMLTMRIHLDDTGPENAPLLVAPGSHRYGLIREETIPAIIDRCGVHACLAARGDVWVYSTPILHASERAKASAHRRVLQLDFSAHGLPMPLCWRGI